jgi:hypothetical protein
MKMGDESDHQYFINAEFIDFPACFKRNALLKKIRKNYPEKDVLLSLEGDRLRIEIPSKYPFWEKKIIMTSIKQEVEEGLFPVITRGLSRG